ncbi:phosphonate metabolism protein/1,5-bisphosphokinase (PRPP-forming) PhnN [Pseudomonas defluvii]|uniref:phosphonate metabolism protein/1,5-bisphosphokinase (PRPP-forming) PhnN n=1 Tax=Pseudomonas defluvii TaxID=1876757 RepID=UPI00390583E3
MQHDASDDCLTVQAVQFGRLIYLMGASGAGKDSLIEAARPVLRGQGVMITRRVITRAVEAKGEDAHGVTWQQFELLCDQKAFALHWQANGLSYGIPAQIDVWLEEGRHVLVNGSRAHLVEARKRYPSLLPILLTVDAGVLRARLLGRARESLDDIERRLERARALACVEDRTVRILDNSGELLYTVSRLLILLREEGVLAAKA